MRSLIVLIFITLSIVLIGQEEKRLALVIGNANYEKGALKNPVNDALLIAKTLDSLGFEVLEYYNLKTQRELKNAIRKFGIKRDSADVGFVYYAGHGVQIKNENYLLPTQEPFDSEIDIEDYAVSVQAILRYLEAKTNQVNILVLDACRDNPFESNWKASRTLKGGGLAKIPPPTGSLIAFSTDAGKTAADGDNKNSIYTRSLSKNMLIEGINIDQVFRNVRSEVLKESKGEQRPVEFTQLTGQEFFLNPGDFEDEFQKIEAIIQDDERDRYTALKIIEFILDEEPNNIRAILDKGRVYRQLKEYKRSLKQYNKIIQLDSNYAKVYMYRATLYGYNLKEEVMALKDFDKSILLAPKNDSYYYKRGIYYLHKLKNFEKALKDFKTAIELTEDLEYYYSLAITNSRMGNDKKAIEIYLKVLELFPSGSRNTLFNLGNISWREKNYNKALEYFNKVVNNFRGEEDDSRIYIVRAFLYEDLKNYDKAIVDYNKAIELDPKDSHPYYFLGQIYQNQKLDYDKAITDYEKAISLNSLEEADLTNTYYQLARSLGELKQFEKQLFNYLKILELDPISINTMNEIGVLYTRIYNDNEKALEYYNRAIELDSTYANAIYNRGFIYLNLGNTNKALNNFNRAIELDSEKSKFYNTRGQVYYIGLQDYKKAIADFEKAIKIDPSDKRIYYHLATSFIGLKFIDKAVITLNKLVELYPKESRVYSELGNIYKDNVKDNKKALEYFDKAIEIEPNSFAGYLKRAEFYHISLKDNDKANDDYLKALELEPEDNNLNHSYINFNFSLKKYKKVIELNNKAIERDLKDPQADYYSALVYLEQKNDFRALNSLSQSIKKIKNDSEDYYISDLDYSRLDLSKVFIMRAELYEKFGENELMCEDLNDAMNYVKDEDLKTVILNKISTECNN